MSDDGYLRRKQRAETTTSTWVLRCLADSDWHPEVRAAVAANECTPAEVLVRLAGRAEHVIVRRAILRNPSASDELKASLGRSPLADGEERARGG